MSGEFSKIQKIILLYIGITSKVEKKESLSKKEIKDGLDKEVGKKLDAKSLNLLVDKKLVINDNDSFYLTDDGKDISREILQDIKDKYGGDADWDIVKKYFDEKTLKPLSVDKWTKEFQKLPENIQDQISSLSDNLKRKKTVSQLTKELIEILNTDKQVRKILGSSKEKFKLNTALSILSNRYTPKAVDLEDILHKEPLEKDEQKRLEKLAKNNFRSQNLMFLILKELDKDHVGDPKGKLTAFLSCCSGKLLPEYRVSMALRGDSSTGKTNLMKTVLKHLPKHWYVWGTRFTRASLEDDVEPFPIIAFSEKTQDDPTVIESLKQLSEDGMQVWKHDKETNKLKDPKFIDRKVCLYSSTEKETDEELATRYIVYTIIKHHDKIKNVINNISKVYRYKDLWISKGRREKKPTWITIGLKQLKDFDVVEIPFAEYILFNNEYSRCQRDVKRFLNLIATYAWLNQYNRYHYEEDGIKTLVASTDDFFWVSYLTIDIFKQTLSNMDRDIEIIVQKYYEMVKQKKHVVLKNKSEEAALSRRQLYWIRRSDLQKELDISLNTLKKRCNILNEKGVFIEHRLLRGNRAFIAIDTKPAGIHLMKDNFEKTYFVMKNIEDSFFDDSSKFSGKQPLIKNSLTYKKHCKYKPKINFIFEDEKLTTKQKNINEDIKQIIRHINIVNKKEKSSIEEYDIDQIVDESEIDWNA